MADPPRRVAVGLLSGGLDSATAVAMAIADGWEVHALTVDYRQRNRAELQAAQELAVRLPVASYRVVRADLRTIGGSALTDKIAVPKDRDEKEIGESIPATYVPARNIVFLSLALAVAEVVDATALLIGVNVVDYAGYPDCTPKFLEQFRRMAKAGTKRGVEGEPIQILAPLMKLSKADIVWRALERGVPLQTTISCYDPVKQDYQWAHCGRCDACRIRARGFAEAGLGDPAPRVR